METQKIVNLLNDTDNEFPKLATRKWYVINDQNNGEYGEGNENESCIKFETRIIKSNLCDYSDASVFVTGNIKATNGNANTKVAFKNCATFRRCVTRINDEHVETAESLDIVMNMYNLIGYSDSYADSSGSLWQFKRDEQNMNSDGNLVDVTTTGSTSFKYKSIILGSPAAVDGDRVLVLRNAKIVVPLKYLSSFFRSLEMSLINCKIHLVLSSTKDCVMSNVD